MTRTTEADDKMQLRNFKLRCQQSHELLSTFFVWDIFRGLWPGHGHPLSPQLICSTTTSRMTTEAGHRGWCASTELEVSESVTFDFFRSVWYGVCVKEWGNSSPFNYIALLLVGNFCDLINCPLKSLNQGLKPISAPPRDPDIWIEMGLTCDLHGLCVCEL